MYSKFVKLTHDKSKEYNELFKPLFIDALKDLGISGSFDGFYIEKIKSEDVFGARMMFGSNLQFDHLTSTFQGIAVGIRVALKTYHNLS